MIRRNHLGLLTLGSLVVLAGCERHSDVTDTAPPPVAPELSEQMEPFEIKDYPADLTQVVIDLADGADPGAVAAALGLALLDVTEVSGKKYGLYADPGPAVDPAALDASPDVDAWTPNYETTLVTGQTLIVGFYEGEWGRVSGSHQDLFEEFDLDAVHAIATGDGVTIAVLDTGADLSHPLLVDNVQTLSAYHELGQEESEGNGPAYGHGTAVAGAAVLVAPDVRVLPIRVLNDDGEGSIFDLHRGMIAAIREGVDIINLSLSINENDPLFQSYVGIARGLGITVLAAGGNAGNGSPAWPGTGTSTVGVAALREFDVVAEFSGIGTNIQLAAPGVEVISAYPNDGFAELTGTSISTPIVAGCVALIREMAPGSTSVVSLTSTRIPVTVEGQPVTGLGRVDPLAALAQAP